MAAEPDDICFAGAAELSRAISRRQLSPVDIVQALQQRIDRLEPKLGAFVEVYRDRAIDAARAAERAIRAGEARGPLHGLPVVLKDVIDLEGEITTAGSRSRLRHRAVQSATLARRLAEAGTIVLGKVQTVEFALGGWGVNEGFGTPWNPWDSRIARVPGGSSSGCGVALAAGMAPLGIGTDMGGSIRLPASFCGVTGLKTTRGRVSNHGIVPVTETLDTAGPMARTVEDAALLYNVVKGYDPRDERTWGIAGDDPFAMLRKGVRGLRLAAMPAAERAGVDDEMLDAYDWSLRLFSELGAEIVEINLPFRFAELFAAEVIAQAESYFLHGHVAADPSKPMDDAVRRRLLAGATTTMADYLAGKQAVGRIRRDFRDAMDGFDALLTPTTESPARPLPETELDKPASRFTRFANLLDLCALAVPNGFNGDGLPLSLQIVCAGYQEATALRIGWAFQDASDWHRRRPAL